MLNRIVDASLMNMTTTNTSKEVSAFSDFPAPDHFPNYMRHAQFLEYLQLYAKHHDLLKYVYLGRTVLQVMRAPDYRESGRWTVRYKVELARLYDGTRNL